VTPFFNNPPYDPGAKYSAPFAMGAMGLAYQSNRVSPSDITGSWADLWNWAPKNPGHAYLITDQVSMLGIALGYLGYNENSGDSSQVEAAANAIIKLKPSTGGLISEDSINQLADEQVWMMPTYNGNVYSALLQAKDPSILKFEYCKGASNFNADNLSIPTSAAHPGNALLFIDWMLAPENMAANVKLSGFAIGTQAGMAAYKELTSNYPFLDMSNSLISNVNNWNQALTGARQKLWDTQWTRVQIAS
jgi:spermidine/putrescine transport system substrate-binding protein